MTHKITGAALSLSLMLACQGSDSKTQAALNGIEQDTSLARDLALAGGDTLLYAEAADVAMEEDTTMRVVTRNEPRKPPARATTPDVPASTPPEVNSQPEPVPPGAKPQQSVCSSPASTDQRRCLMQYLAKSDASLNRTYQRVVGQLGPAEKDRLRIAQRAWLVYRDTECRRKTRSSEGALWAPVRARCLGEYSAARERELAAKLQ